jgi:hypothetical protein
MNTERVYLAAWGAAGFALGYRGGGAVMGILFAVGIALVVAMFVEMLGAAGGSLRREIHIVAAIAGAAALLYILTASHISLGSGGTDGCTETRFTTTCR